MATASKTQKQAIQIAAEGRKHLSIELVGVKYQVKPPKTALAMRVAIQAKEADDDPTIMVKGLEKWITAAFGEKTAAKVWERLEDPDDDLDIDHVMTLMERLMEASSGNPTS